MKFINAHRPTPKIVAVLILTLASLGASAAVETERYKNGTLMTHLFLWSDNPLEMTFNDIDLSDKKLAGWTLPLNYGDRLVAEGPEIKKAKGKFEVEFDFSTTTFNFQFAEVLFDDATGTWTLQDTGNIEYSGKKLEKPVFNALTAVQNTHISNYFAAPSTAVVPVPASAVLMVSALGLLGVTRRRPGRDRLAAA